MEEKREAKGGAAAMQVPAESEEKQAREAGRRQEDGPKHEAGSKEEAGGLRRETGKEEVAGEKSKSRRTVIYTLVVLLYALVVKILFFMRIEGRENIPRDRNCVLLGNHQCLLDPAPAFDNIYQMINNPVFKSHDHIQIS